MWIFTKFGFFSAVCARQGSGKHGQPVEPTRIMYRLVVRTAPNPAASAEASSGLDRLRFE